MIAWTDTEGRQILALRLLFALHTYVCGRGVHFPHLYEELRKRRGQQILTAQDPALRRAHDADERVWT